jgi:hypothetical protein
MTMLHKSNLEGIIRVMGVLFTSLKKRVIGKRKTANEGIIELDRYAFHFFGNMT